VVVGSGAGGGVVAAELAAAGQDVIVLEKGEHHETGDIDQLEVASFRRLYLDAGLTATADQGVILLAGSCLGGGTVVNYTTSFATPDGVRAEWSRVSGLDLFTSSAFTRSLDAVCARLGVNTDHGAASSRDAIMEAGLRACGWHVATMPRDVVGCTQDDVCGYCGFGCARDAKRSTLRTYLEDAAAGRARFVVECDARRVIVERGVAVGVEARSRGGARLRVRARAVVAAAGAVNTPALLLRSGLGGEVGNGLRLHPVTAAWALFDREVRPWTGTVQSRYSNELADLDGGYGVRFETAPVHPAFQAIGATWDGADAFAATMDELPRTSLVGLLVRDRDGGRVTVARSGRPVLRYQVSPYDQRHVRRGLEAAARVLLAAGARRVRAVTARPAVLEAGGSVDEWLALLDHIGYGPNRTGYVTFHQMGSCRMGADAARGAVDGAGQSHEVRRLFVADASLFPNASGVNPMITVMALAHHVAQEMKAVL
jgi:choline dehydrogenase-like flavoprotein